MQDHIGMPLWWWCGAVLLLVTSAPTVTAWGWSSQFAVSSFIAGDGFEQQPAKSACAFRMSLRTGSQKEAPMSRKRFLEAVSSGVSATAFALSPVGALEAPESFTVAFNASKGSLGIGLQELRYPKKKAPWDSQKEVVTVSSVDPYGQGVKQDRRIRPGLVITSVQGRGVEGLSAKEVIKQLEDEMLARSAGDTRAAEDEGLPELVEITFSSKCVSVPEEPDFCFNSVQPLDSVIGSRD
mmetsp:Transcript_35461/g.70954  ORF Transcript_35461/g.70954 Transcript_35461/m.70954 type:complete len:239 (-) Transcript_35461:287-1003(-)